MKKYFKSTKLTLIFYSLFVAFDNFYQIISLKFFYFRSLLEEYFFEDFQIKFSFSVSLLGFENFPFQENTKT